MPWPASTPTTHQALRNSDHPGAPTDGTNQFDINILVTFNMTFLYCTFAVRLCWICFGSPFSVVLSHYVFLFGFLRLTLLCGSFIEALKLVGGKEIDRYRVFSVRYSLFSVLFQDAQVIL